MLSEILCIFLNDYCEGNTGRRTCFCRQATGAGEAAAKGVCWRPIPYSNHNGFDSLGGDSHTFGFPRQTKMEMQ
jgi:hypothetical protein